MPDRVVPDEGLDSLLPKRRYRTSRTIIWNESSLDLPHSGRDEGGAVGQLDRWVSVRWNEMDRVNDSLYLLSLPAPTGAELLVVGKVSERGILDLFGLISDEEYTAFAISRKALN